MVQKGRTTVWVDTDLAKRVEEDLGINLSKLTSQALEIADSEVFGDIAVGMRIKITEEIIAETEQELSTLNRRREVLEKRLQENREKIVAINKDWELVKNSVMLSRHVYQLNQVIIAARYDLPTIRVAGEEYIRHVEQLNPLWKLDIHVAAFKQEMDKLK